MKKTTFKIFSLLVLCLAVVWSCEKFESFTDDADILSINIYNIDTTHVSIVGQEINVKNSNVQLFVKGKLEEFPLKLNAKFTTSANSKIFRENDFETLNFNAINDSVSMLVIAQSGLPKKWMIKLSDQRNGQADVEKMNIQSHLPAEVILKELPVTIYKSIKRVEIFVEDGLNHFPLTTENTLTLTPKATIVGANGNNLTADENGVIAQTFLFPTPQSISTLQVRSEKGDTAVWTVAIRTKYSDEADILGFTIKNYIPSNIVFGKVRIDHLNSEVVIGIADGVTDPANFMVSISQPAFTLTAGTTIGNDYNGELNFESITRVPQITLYSENGQQRIWKFRLEYKFGTPSVFESFRVSQVNPSDITLDKNGVIDAVNRTILLKVTKGVRKFPLTLAAEAQVTAGGEIIDPLNKLYFKDIDAKNKVQVRSQNAAVSLWDISLRDLESSQSNANAITKLSVTNVVPSGTVITPQAAINADKHEITLQVQKLPSENAGKAILAEVGLEISPDAYIVNNTNFTGDESIYRGTLRFESLNSSNEIKIEAANGTSQIWKVVLAYQALTGNNIEAFQIKSYIPIEFKLGNFIELDRGQQTIEITVNDGLEHFPLTLTPEITLSENARILSANRYVFEKITDQLKIIVASESGQEKIWTLKLKNNVFKDDKNNVEAFQVTGTIPEIVEVQGTVIDPSHKTVTVYVKNTSYPLILSGNTTVSPAATIVSPFHSYRFENAQQTHIISVQAQNGIIQDWKLLLSDASPASNKAEILRAIPISVTPAYNNISGVTIDGNTSNVAIGVYEGATYPMILKVAFNVSAGAKITNLNSDNNLNFSDRDAKVSLNVLAENGSLRMWTVSQNILPQPVKAFTLLSSEKTTDNTVNHIKQVEWNADNSIDVYGLTSGAISETLRLHFSAKVRYEIATARSTRALGTSAAYSETIDIPLNTLGANGGRIIVSAENGYTKNYEIQFKFEVRRGSDLAQVVGFKLNQIRPLYIVAPDVMIDPASHEVVLKTNYTTSFLPFTFIAEIQTSPFSLLTGISNGQLIDIERADKTIRFNIKSESGVTNDGWTLRVQHDAAAANTAADVEAFIITSHLPAEIKTGSPVIDKAAKLIKLDVLNWLKNQTLYLTARPTLSANATCNLPDLLSFTNPNGSIAFQVVSESGRTENWTLKLNFTAGSDADVTAFTVKSHMPEELVLNNAVINKTLQEVAIPVVSNLQFPVRIRPEITVSQGATALNAPLEYVFNSLEDIKKLQIEAEDGIVKEWNIRLSYSFNDEADVITMTAGSAPTNVSIGAINVKTAQRVVEVNINNWNGYNEFSMTPALTLSAGATATLPNTVTFTKKTAEEIKFTVTAEDKTTKKEWTLRLVYEESNKTNLESMAINGYTPSGIQLKSLGVIDNAAAVVYIDIDKWNGNKDLTINNYTFETQDNAKTLNLPATLTFTKESKESLSFKVRAQDGVTERNWTIRLRYTEVSNAVINAFDIASTNRPSVILGTAVIADPTITVPVTQGVRDGFNSSYMIQANVIISENGVNRTQPVTMTFNSINDQKTFVVTDEFGIKKTWTVQLANKASNKAEIVSLTPQAFTGGSSDLRYWRYTQSGNSYKIYVTDIVSKDKYGTGNWPTITMNDGAIQISDKAAANIDLKLPFNLKTHDLKKSIQITADDGMTVNNYTVELVYCPQFENSNFSQWYVNGDKVYQPGVSGKGSFWVTANMEYSGAVNDGTTPYSPNGARMYSKEVGVAGINKFAAGSTFLGTFRKPTSIGEATGNPTALTTFGVEFRGRPKAVRITCGYNKDNSVDQGEIWVAGNYSGHSEDRKTTATAYGEKWFGITNGIKTYDVEINYKTDAPLTMLTISLTSSYLGAEFKGSVGAEFIVTNIELIYE